MNCDIPEPNYDFSMWCTLVGCEGEYSFKDKRARILDEILSEEKKEKGVKNESIKRKNN